MYGMCIGQKGERNIKIKPEVIQLIRDAANSAYQYLMIEFMYQNGYLEGLGFSYNEVNKIIHQNMLTGCHNIYDAHLMMNLKVVFEYMIDTLEKPINGDMILTMHAIVADKTWEDRRGFKGCWKTLPNCIIGSDIAFVDPENVEEELQKLQERWNASNKTLDDITEYHIQFEHIHPLQSCNGIIGRLLMLKQCMEHDVDLIIITEEYAGTYIEELYSAQKLGDDGRFKALIPKCQQAADILLPTLKHTLETVDWDQVIADSMIIK